MRLLDKILRIKWGIILIVVGIGVIFALVMPAEAMVVALAILLVFVGICLLKNDKRRF